MVGVAGENVLALLTRAPGSGGKTRLFAALGVSPDTALLTALLLDTLDNARAAGVSVVVAVTPPSACDAVRAWLSPGSGRAGASLAPGGNLVVVAQPEGTIGDRMRDLFGTLLEQGAMRVALIGSDLPSITPALVRSAFAAIERDPAAVALGPASDGGYYLIAASRVPPLFDGIDWGSARVLEQTIAAAALAGVRVHLLEPLADVDTPADLRAAALAPGAVRTRLWVRAHLTA